MQFHGSIVVVDLATRRVVRTIHVVCCALGVTARAGQIVVTVAHDGPGEIVRIDAASAAIVSRTTVAPDALPREVADDRVRGGGALWVAHFLTSSVTRVPLAGGS